MCCCCGRKQAKLLRESIEQGLLVVAKELAMLRFVLSKPGRLGLRQVGESGMPGYVMTLPAVTTGNPVQRELLIKVGEADTVVQNPALDAVESERFSGQYEQALHAELVDIDAVGNRSVPSMFDAVLVDGMAPPQPGVLGIKQVDEDE